jgi:hypothetical protein
MTDDFGVPSKLQCYLFLSAQQAHQRRHICCDFRTTCDYSDGNTIQGSPAETHPIMVSVSGMSAANYKITAGPDATLTIKP